MRPSHAYHGTIGGIDEVVVTRMLAQPPSLLAAKVIDALEFIVDTAATNPPRLVVPLFDEQERNSPVAERAQHSTVWEPSESPYTLQPMYCTLSPEARAAERQP